MIFKILNQKEAAYNVSYLNVFEDRISCYEKGCDGNKLQSC